MIELPPGPYLGVVDDHNHRWVQDLGLPGPDAGKGGKHLVLPPDHDGEVPDGFYVGRSSTYKAYVVIRALPLDGDLDAALERLSLVKVYPLAQADGTAEFGFVDVTEEPIDLSCLAWEDNLQFWETLHAIVDYEPVLEEFRPTYGELAALGIAKGRAFEPDARMRSILEAAARTGRDQMLVAALASDRPDRVAWEDRRWEWVGLQPDSGDFETPAFLDTVARERWFAQAVIASPAMFRRKVGFGSLYWLVASDASGAYLDGGQSYRLRIPQPVQARLFWSVTVYDAQTRSQIKTDQGKAALRSLVEDLQAQDGEAVDLYFGPTPAPGNEGRWIQTSPGQGWFVRILPNLRTRAACV